MADEPLNAEDEGVFRLWQQGLLMNDPRYYNEALVALARQAMIDDEFRDKLVNDTETVLGELPSKFTLPEGVTLTFLENTQDTLNVVLPPRTGEASNRSPAFRELLRSRTGAEVGLFRDDFNSGNIFDSTDHGDADIRDFLLITQPEDPIIT
jgi:hypothetical protein